jgi:hypothetical protein
LKGYKLTESCFIDPKHPPTADEIKLALGPCFSLWNRLITFIENTYHIKGTWSTWGPAKSGWNLWFRRNRKSLAAIHPQQERILIQVVLGKTSAERALQLELGAKTSQILRQAPQLRDGRWLFIPVTSESDVQDVEQLLLIKMHPPPNT